MEIIVGTLCGHMRIGIWPEARVAKEGLSVDKKYPDKGVYKISLYVPGDGRCAADAYKTFEEACRSEHIGHSVGILERIADGRTGQERGSARNSKTR